MCTVCPSLETLKRKCQTRQTSPQSRNGRNYYIVSAIQEVFEGTVGVKTYLRRTVKVPFIRIRTVTPSCSLNLIQVDRTKVGRVDFKFKVFPDFR